MKRLSQNVTQQRTASHSDTLAISPPGRRAPSSSSSTSTNLVYQPLCSSPSMDRLESLGNALSQITMYDIKSVYNQVR